MKILITGSSGTVGTRLFEKLDGLGHEIIGLDIQPNRYNPALDERTILTDLTQDINIKWVNNPDIVVHLANHARVWKLVQKPELAMENMRMNFNVMEWCRHRGIPRVIFASSREVYGNIKDQALRVSEWLANVNKCESAYSASKNQAESLLHAYNICYNMQFIILRLSNVYGLYDFSDRVIPKWIKACSTNDPLVVYGETKTLDFTYIDDTVDGIIRAIENFDTAKNQTINIASGKGVKLSDVAAMIIRMMDSKSEIEYSDELKGEVYWFEANINKAHGLLGYKPTVLLEDGLLQTIEWYKEVGYV